MNAPSPRLRKTIDEALAEDVMGKAGYIAGVAVVVVPSGAGVEPR